MTSFSGVTFVLFCFVFVLMLSLRPALRSIVLRYTGATIATRVIFLSFFPFVYLEMSLFPIFFCAVTVFSFYEITSYVLSFRMVIFYLVTTGWIFEKSSIDQSINQSINRAYCLSSRNATLEKKQLATVINSSAVGLPSFAFFVRPFLSTVTNFTYTRATQIIYT